MLKMPKHMVPVTDELKNLFNCSECSIKSSKLSIKTSFFKPSRIKSLKSKQKNTKAPADYDEGGEAVTLNHLKCDEGQRGAQPILMSSNLMKLIGRDLNVVVNETLINADCSNAANPRKAQLKFNGRKTKVFRVGEKFYAKLNECQPNDKQKFNQNNCCGKFKLDNPKLALIGANNPPASGTCGYGIQLGSASIDSEYFPADIRGKQALDVVLVAHGFSSLKAPVNWTQLDIDLILNLGTQLFNSTKHEPSDHRSSLTKGFTVNRKFIQVSLSEPIYAGTISSVNGRSMNPSKALNSFFKQHRYGIFQSSTVDLYIAVDDAAVVVFSPRARSMDCNASSCGEAALMVFQSIENVSYLITHRSSVDESARFELRAVSTVRISNSKYAGERFAVIKRAPRSAEFESFSEQVSILRGNLHARSDIFKQIDGRQHLTASIMSVIYAKIDPPDCWSSDVLDRVLHFAARFYLDCVGGGGATRDLRLIDIPSEFYVGDAYRARIAIVPLVTTVEIMSNGLFSDDAITRAIKSAFDLSFRCLLLQIDNVSLSIWQMRTNGNRFFLYDCLPRDSMGKPDYVDGRASLLMFGRLDDLCKNVGERIGRNFYSSSSSKLHVHGLRVIELLALTKTQHGKLPRLVMRKCQPVLTLTASAAKHFADTPSLTDSISPLLTAEQQRTLSAKKARKLPEYLLATNLNSPSLVCSSSSKSFEAKELASAVARDIYEEIMKRATGEGRHDESDDDNSKSEKVDSHKPAATCNRFVTCVEKVLLSTDLRCLQRERDDIINNFSTLLDPFEVLAEARADDAAQVSHFRKLPDMSAIVRGTRDLTAELLSGKKKICSVENLAVITAISALITASFQPIESWSCTTIDCVISSAYCMSNFIQLNPCSDFSTIDEHRMPKVRIDDRLFNVKMVAIASGEWCDLAKKLNHLGTTVQCTSFVLVTSHGSVAIFMRENFCYFFEHATCNFLGRLCVGADDASSSSCLLRFCSLSSMLERIFANHPEMKRQQRFLICRLLVEQIKAESDEEAAFVPFTKAQEKEIVDKMLQAAVEKLKERLCPIDREIELEKARIENYYDETGQMRRLDVNGSDSEFNVDDFKLRVGAAAEDNGEDDSATLAVTSQPYHRRDKRDYDSDRAGYANHPNRQHPMIMGSFAYSDRMTSECELKPCHFACIFAYLVVSIHHRPETMNRQHVDFILKNGLRLYERFERVNIDKFMQCDQFEVTNVRINGMQYNVKLGIHNTDNVDMAAALTRFFRVRKYALLQATNCALLLFKHANCFTIFDAYDEFETSENRTNVVNRCPSAAFIQFPNLNDAICYVNDRVCSPFTVRCIHIASWQRIRSRKTASNSILPSQRLRKDDDDGSCKYAEHSANEKVDWIYGTKTIPWRYTTTICEKMRQWRAYNVVIDNKLFSLWSNLHPNMAMFKQHAGKQHLACSVLALVMAQLYDIDEWNDALLDSIVAHGHKYHIETVSRITEVNHRLRVEELSRFCTIEDLRFELVVVPAGCGVLYADSNDFLSMNLNRTLKFIFDVKMLPGVVLECNGKFLAIGTVGNRDYFMFDCQSHGSPAFRPGEGRAYMLKCCCMKVLVACVVLTLNVKTCDEKFRLYEVKSRLLESDESYGNHQTATECQQDS